MREQGCVGSLFNIGGSNEICGTTPRIDQDAAASSSLDFLPSCATPCATGDYWACVGRVSWSPPNATNVMFDLTVKDVGTGSAASGVDVAVCGPEDLNCTQPYASGQTNTTGQVLLTFQNVLSPTDKTGLNGYLQLTSPSLAPFNVYWGSPLSEAHFTTYAEVSTVAEIQQFFAGLNVKQDPGHGNLVATVVDCILQPAPGVQVTLSSADTLTQEFNLTGSAVTETDGSGTVVFTNVPPGLVTVTATPSTTGKASSKSSVYVKTGVWTALTMFPTP